TQTRGRGLYSYTFQFPSYMQFNPPLHIHQTPKPTKQTQTKDVHQVAIDKTSANPNKALA
ncbi:hypothetical protein ACR2V7_25725, partial [Klebsiella pneumoniae]